MSAPDDSRSEPVAGLQRDWLWGLLLIFIVVLVYLPVRHAGFLWDDDTYITANPSLVGWHGLKKIWTSAAVDISPLTSTTFWLEHAMWGEAPFPYHLVNVLMHGACAVAFWRVLRSLPMPGAWLGAALWALHPVQVESVAWAAELKNPESGLFFLLAIYFFIKWTRSDSTGERSGSDWSYGWSLLFGVLAMASKSSTVILPAVLCLYAWWKEGRWRWRNLAIMWPFFLLSGLASLTSIWFEQGQIAGLHDSQWGRTWPERFLLAGSAIWFYLDKLIWPYPLATIYPHWTPAAGAGMSPLPLIAVVVVMVLLWAMRGTRWRPLFFVFAYFLIALAPVLGFVNNFIFRYSLVFDHFQYLASMMPLALAGSGIYALASFLISGASWVRCAACAGILLVLGAMSYQRAWVYKDGKTYWTDAVAKNPESPVAYVDLGLAFFDEGRMEESITLFRKAAAVDPSYADAYLNIGNGFLTQGRFDEAMTNYRKTLDIDPRSFIAYYNMGNILLKRGDIDEALLKMEKSVGLRPDRPTPHDGLGEALIAKGDLDQAAAQFRFVLTLDPANDEAHYCQGVIASRQGRGDDAVTEFQQVRDSSPRKADADEGLGEALAKTGRLEEAAAAYRRAFAKDPKRARAELGLGLALAKSGHADDAMVELEKAVELDPSNAEAFNNLGNVFVQKGRLDEAVVQYQKSLEIDPGHAMTHNNLGAVYFRMKQWDQAIAQFQALSAIEPKSDAPHFYLGLAYSQKGDAAKAIAEYRKALAINPNNAQAQANLAAALAPKNTGR